MENPQTIPGRTRAQSTEETFYSSTRRYRNSCRISIFYLLLFFLCWFTPAALTQIQYGPGGQFLALGFVLFLFFSVVSVGRKLLLNPGVAVQISSLGIQVGNDFYPWQYVNEISIVSISSPKGRWFSVLAHLPGEPFPIAFLLIGDVPLSNVEMQSILTELSEYVAPRWPKVKIDVAFTNRSFPVDLLPPAAPQP